MSSRDRAKKRQARQQRKAYAKPSLPRMIGANDNHANDNSITVGIDDRDDRALRIAKARAVAAERADAKAAAERLVASGVLPEDVRVIGSTVTAKRVGGLEWLLKKQRITLTQHRAGEQYGDDFAKADEPGYRSCLNDRVGGASDTMQEQKALAGQRLRQARRGALQSHEGLISLMDEVCGRGIRVREIAKGDDADAARIEAQVKLGLDFLASYYGMV